MTRTLETVAGEPDRIRLTFTNSDGTSIIDDMTIEEADEFGRQLISMAGLRSRRQGSDAKIYIA